MTHWVCDIMLVGKVVKDLSHNTLPHIEQEALV